MPDRRIETLDDIRAALEALTAADPRLCAILERAGEVPLRRRPAGYAGLAGIIVSQMVSRASADAIFARLMARLGTLTPEAVLGLEEGDFRAIGLSRAKQAALVSAAEAVTAGRIDLEHLCTLPPEDAIASLTALKGLGPWTAEVYLLFCAGHPDIFPAGDVALQNAAAHALGLEARPADRQLRQIAEGWRPHRGVAARLLWAYYARAMSRQVTALEV